MNKVPVALQLWSVREEIQKDFSATVDAVARIGYPAVELAGFGTLDAKGARAALDAAGLKVAGMHVSAETLQSNLNKAVDDALTVGSSHVTCPSWPASHYVSAAACERVGETLNRIGADLRAYGLRFSFHNHDKEAKLIEGKTVLEWMLGASEPRNLAAEPDVYWLHVGGQAPGAFLLRNAGRCPLVHLKDKKAFGSGPVDFEEVFRAVDSIEAIEWLIVEDEWHDCPALDSVRLCFEQLQRWGRA
jgi:sugar phosphate isomerase/epimerase